MPPARPTARWRSGRCGERHEIRILRDLARRYAEAAARPIQDERRELRSAHNSLKATRPLILVTYGIWNAWCRNVIQAE